jgi:hypothetical protein
MLGCVGVWVLVYRSVLMSLNDLLGVCLQESLLWLWVWIKSTSTI